MYGANRTLAVCASVVMRIQFNDENKIEKKCTIL